MTVVSQRWRVKGLAVLAVIGWWVLGTSGPARGHSWSEARVAHDAGKYETAIAHYEALVEAGVRHEALYYNLGNAYFRAGRLGPAIFAYERALHLEPGLDDARHNARLARAAAFEQQETRIRAAESAEAHALADGRFESLMLRAAAVVRIDRVELAFLIACVAFFAGLIVVRYMRPGFAHATLIVANVFTGVGLAVSAFLLMAHIHVSGVHTGVVLPVNTSLRVAPSAEAAQSGRAYAGLRVRVLARDSEWLNVRLADGDEGWVVADDIGVVR